MALQRQSAMPGRIEGNQVVISGLTVNRPELTVLIQLLLVR
jgi:hypothetical protein